jgi:ATPase, P-type (transporting), HAD superfamily, subfamily IC
MNKKWYNMEDQAVFEELNTTEKGLNTNEVTKRLEIYGKNELPQKKEDSLFKLFFSQFKDSIIMVMLVAAFFSFMVGETLDAIVILFIILLDAVMGTFQEWNAHKNADSLKQMIKTMSMVLRDGKEVEIEAKDIVPGDIILLQSGSIVPADMRLISSNNLTADESSLTGESVASIKHISVISGDIPIGNMDNMSFAGTTIVTGRGVGVVVGTGLNTEIGKIATEVTKADDAKSPLTIRVDKFSKQISIMIVLLAIFLVILLLAKSYNYDEIFLSVIALAVSAMPEGLPLALTMALTIGSNRMSKRNIIVKKMSAVESLGSCTVIASDKTGTLTVNEQTAKKIILPSGEEFNVTGTGYNDDGDIENRTDFATLVAKLGVLNNESHLEKEKDEWKHHGDSIDVAFLALGKKGKVDISSVDIDGLIPYESENKYSAVFYRDKGINYATAKGSIDTILSFCDRMYDGNNIVPINKERILSQNEKLASNGYRVIALAYGDNNDFIKKDYYDETDLPKLIFCGLVGFIDPIRKEAISAVKEVKKAGIKVVMITGDHPLTAFSIAKELEIADQYEMVATSNEIAEYLEKSEEEFENFIKEKTVFTRVTPIQKLEIVEAYKRMGEFVAVTGDGVNDAPALKVANIGVAMGSGTDVAKETSTMIITDDNFNSIVAGVEEGRCAYSNIRKVTYMLISCGIAEVLFFVLSIIIGLPMPLVAIQLLWLNVVTDGFQDLALSFEKKEANIMDEKPRDPKSSLFDKKLIQEVLLAGFFIGIIVFIVWIYLINGLNMKVESARGYVMALMVFMQNIHVLNCRSEKTSVFKMKWNNPLLIMSILLAVTLQIIIMEVPVLSKFMQTTSIPVGHLVLLFLCAIPVLFVMETYKKLCK